MNSAYEYAYLRSPEVAAGMVGDVCVDWRKRINDVVSSPYNLAIPRCEDAGKLDGYTITMHNGVKVCAAGYYGSGILNMLIENRGVHEPQEESIFEAVIRGLPQDPIMLELGSYWAFYSLSLLNQRPKSRCFMVEPEAENLVSGQVNFRLNKRQGFFTQAFVGRDPKDDPLTISVDSFCDEHNISYLDILHADIQGYELEMLEGASLMLSFKRVGHVFVSTHTNQLHYSCIDLLKEYGYTILEECDLNSTCSVDGLIVAKNEN
jgi:hypothetical protein